MSKRQIQVNIQTMLKDLGTLLHDISDSKMKQKYAQFLYCLTRADGKQPSLQELLMMIDSNIKDSKKSKNTTTETNSKFVATFWKKVQTIIVETYNKNKELKNG